MKDVKKDLKGGACGGVRSRYTLLACSYQLRYAWERRPPPRILFSFQKTTIPRLLKLLSPNPVFIIYSMTGGCFRKRRKNRKEGRWKKESECLE
jgi:hypothetical protein